MPIILILALIAAGGGISFKAQSAVPGDVLYVVKTHIDEPVASFFSLTNNGRIAAAEQQAGARLGEAEQLASSGLLDTATKSSLEAAFEVKAAEASARIQNMAASGDMAGAFDQATAFRTLLERHQVALADAYGAKTDSASLAADISSSVSVALGKAESLQADSSTMAAAPGTTRVAQAQIPNPPEAGGSAAGNDSTTTANFIGSAILSFLSKVI